MGYLIFDNLENPYLEKSINMIQDESIEFKKAIIGAASVNKTDVKHEVVSSYLSTINAFLKTWESYANELTSSLKQSAGKEKVYAIPYQAIKDVIHMKNDYASVLPFTDGIIKLCEKTKKPDEFTDFMIHTVNKAFPAFANSIAEVVENAMINYDEYSNSDMLEAKYFDSIRNLKIFNDRDRTELYKAIDHTIRFLSSRLNIDKYFLKNDLFIYLSAVGAIIDYITYTLTVYACRVFMIVNYAKPYINYNAIATAKPVKESVVTSSLSIEIKHEAYKLFAMIDDGKYLDVNNNAELMNKFDEFNMKIGGGISSDTHGDGYRFNMFVKSVNGNPLISHIIKRRCINYTEPGVLTGEYNVMKEMVMYNNNNDVSHATPLDELLYSIKLVKPEKDTIDGYGSLMADLSMYTELITKWIIDRLCVIDTFNGNYHNYQPTYATPSISLNKSMEEYKKLLLEFYKRFIPVVIAKARDIESIINIKRDIQYDKVNNAITIKDITTNDRMMGVVPNTAKKPIDMVDMYARPTFESLLLYDEYVKCTLGIEDDMYYSEAFGISDLFDKILSLIMGSITKLKTFVNNNSIKAAVEWVKKHEKELLAMDFSTVEMQVVPYKMNIELHPKFNHLQATINSFDDKILNDEEAHKKFVHDLYGDDTIYSWFHDDKYKTKDAAGKVVNNGPTLYKHYMLFYDIGNTNENVPNAVTISGKTVQKNISEWIKTVTTFDTVTSGYTNIGNNINKAVTSMKNKVTQISNKVSTDTTTKDDEKKEAAPSMNTSADNKPKEQHTASKADNAEKNHVGSSTSLLLTEVSTAVTNLYTPLNDIFIEYMKVSYNYLKDAYLKGRQISNNTPQ